MATAAGSRRGSRYRSSRIRQPQPGDPLTHGVDTACAPGQTVCRDATGQAACARSADCQAPLTSTHGYTPWFGPPTSEAHQDAESRALRVRSLARRIKADGLEACSRLRVLEVLTEDQKRSASWSFIAFCKDRVTGIRLAVKGFAWFDLDRCAPFADMGFTSRQHAHVSGLQYEACMYEKATPRLATPNLVKPLGSTRLSSKTLRTANIAFVKAVARAGAGLGLDHALKGDCLGVELVFTELRPAVKSLHRIMVEDSPSPDVLRALAFQIVYTVYAMQQGEVQHHDLHLGNVLVDLKPHEVHIEYRAAGFVFQVPMTSGKVMVFDWDLGYSPACGANPRLSQSACQALSACNQMTLNYDWAQLLYKLLITAITLDFREFASFVRAFLPVDAVSNMSLAGNPRGYPCFRPQDGRAPCAAWPTDQPTWLSELEGPEQALAHAYFDPLRL